MKLDKENLEQKTKGIDKQLELTIQSISEVEINHMLKKIDDKRYKGILSVLEEELINLAEKKCATDWLKVGRYKLSSGMEIFYQVNNINLLTIFLLVYPYFLWGFTITHRRWKFYLPTP